MKRCSVCASTSLNHLEKKSLVSPAKKCTTRILSFPNQAVNESCYRGDDSVLKSLVEIADTAPKYLRPNLEATLQLSLKVSQYVNQLYFILSSSLFVVFHYALTKINIYNLFRCAWWFLETARLC